MFKCEGCGALGYADAAELNVDSAMFKENCRRGELPGQLEAG